MSSKVLLGNTETVVGQQNRIGIRILELICLGSRVRVAHSKKFSMAAFENYCTANFQFKNKLRVPTTI